MEGLLNYSLLVLFAVTWLAYFRYSVCVAKKAHDGVMKLFSEVANSLQALSKTDTEALNSLSKHQDYLRDLYNKNLATLEALDVTTNRVNELETHVRLLSQVVQVQQCCMQCILDVDVPGAKKKLSEAAGKLAIHEEWNVSPEIQKPQT